MASFATSNSVGLAPRYVRCDIDADVSTRNKMIVMIAFWYSKLYPNSPSRNGCLRITCWYTWRNLIFFRFPANLNAQITVSDYSHWLVNLQCARNESSEWAREKIADERAQKVVKEQSRMKKCDRDHRPDRSLTSNCEHNLSKLFSNSTLGSFSLSFSFSPLLLHPPSRSPFPSASPSLASPSASILSHPLFHVLEEAAQHLFVPPLHSPLILSSFTVRFLLAEVTITSARYQDHRRG